MTRSAWWFVFTIGCGLDQPVGVDPSANPGTPAGPAATTATPRTWREITTPVSFAAAVPAMLQDGSILIQAEEGTDWWKLTPDAMGKYDDGTFTQIATAPNGYNPLYAAMAILPDGRMIVEGGEYLNGASAWTTEGAIYDPVANTWKSVQPPATWTSIGDASGIVLPDGTFMLSDCCSTNFAKLDPATLTWTAAGANKADWNDEESWAELPDGRIVTADANVQSGIAGDLMHAEIYTPGMDMWSSAGEVPVELDDVQASDPDGSSHEVGPAMTLPDGRVVAIGGTVHNALFDPSTMTWTALQDTPNNFATQDGPGATMPNGDLLFASAPYGAGESFPPGVVFYEVSDAGQTFTEVGDTKNAASNSSYNNFLIILPTGEIMHTDFSSDIEIYTPAPGYAPAAVPQILAEPKIVGTNPEAPTAPVPTLYKGRSYTVDVARMNGINLGAVYGDDVQTSTNFPLVRVTAMSTGHVWYCRTHDPSDRSIAFDERGTATFDIPASVEGGTAEISVIANGIPSAALSVNIK